jgi:hypothetical protein
VDVSFGKPLPVADVWHEKPERGSFADWSQDDTPGRDYFVQEFVGSLARQVQEGVNQSATASATALVAAVWLAHGQDLLLYSELKRDISLLQVLIPAAGRALNFQWTNETTSPAALLELCESWDFFTSEFISLNEQRCQKNYEKELSFWWYRGTIFHILALFGMVAKLFTTYPQASEEKHVEIFNHWRLLWDKELYWPQTISSEQLFQSTAKILVPYITQSFGVGPNPHNRNTLNFLEQFVLPECDTYAMALVVKNNLTGISLHEQAYAAQETAAPPFMGRLFQQQMNDGFNYLETIAEEQKKVIFELLGVPKWDAFLAQLEHKSEVAPPNVVKADPVSA